jgi:hypothetical protein
MTMKNILLIWLFTFSSLGALAQREMITVTHKEGKYYFTISDSLLNRDILITTRISKSGASLRAAHTFAGDQTSGSIIRFEKGKNDHIFIRKPNYSARVKDSSSAMYENLERSNIQPILASFPIVTQSAAHQGYLIDVTTFLNTDNELIFSVKGQLNVGNMASDRSYMLGIKSFPGHLELTANRTYTLNNGGIATFEVNTSIVLLPKVPMRPRYADARIGYYSFSYTDFDKNPQGIQKIEMVDRWRLEPKPEDMEKYKRGELVEPQKPIIFYIDPTTPKQWIPYLIAGINDWRGAFEKAGFKNAISGRLAPTAAEDSTWTLEDALHSAVIYKPSEVSNASGIPLVDPRSGEILESHIEWHHNVMKILHDMYMIQAGAIDQGARKMIFDPELMGALIRYLIAHEVGHSLGLQHNYGASSTVPSEKLRDKQFLEQNGYTPSIMDYARFNYVAQPEDRLSRQSIIPAIGDYDLWAIEWGYRYFPSVTSSSEEVSLLNQLTIEKMKNHRLWFAGERSEDPRAQTEDIGNNPVISGTYGIKNLKRIIPQLPGWTRLPNHDYSDLTMIYEQVVSQYKKYVTHAFRYIGGTYQTLKTVEQSGPVYSLVPMDLQRSAMKFINTELFNTPAWLFNDTIEGYTGLNMMNQISAYQTAYVDALLKPAFLLKILPLKGKNDYNTVALLSDLQQGIFPERDNNYKMDQYRRNLQKYYIHKLIALSQSPEIANNDLEYLIRGQLVSLMHRIQQSIAGVKGVEWQHLKSIHSRIRKSLNHNK